MEKIPAKGEDSPRGAVKKGPPSKEGQNGRVEVMSTMGAKDVEDRASSSSTMRGSSILYVKVMKDSWTRGQNIPFGARRRERTLPMVAWRR